MKGKRESEKMKGKRESEKMKGRRESESKKKKRAAKHDRYGCQCTSIGIPMTPDWLPQASVLHLKGRFHDIPVLVHHLQNIGSAWESTCVNF